MERFNPWWANEPDILYEEWKEAKAHWVPDLVNRINLKPFSLHFLTGPRQVGKTTAIKILIQDLMEKRPTKSIFYYSCDELTDHVELGELLDNYLSARKAWGIKTSIILLDEVTFVEDWWRAIKSRIDSGDLKKDVLVVTGSARIELLRQKETFPGRRGNGEDYILHPLGFSKFVNVLSNLETREGGISALKRNIRANSMFSERLAETFKDFTRVGGFPRSIQDHARYGKVMTETSRTCLDWMRGDWGRIGRCDKSMKEIVSYLFRAKGTPISWNSIAAQTSINSPNTARSYVETLEGIQSLIVLNLIHPDSRVDHRKNKKVHFSDPFIFKVLGDYVGIEAGEDWLLEATVGSHLSRFCPVYYWRNRTEVDVVCLHDGEQVGFEISKGIKKWKSPWHIRESHLLDKDNLPLYLSALKA
jgi:predicted AAA+ superfamily ATPase